MKDDGSNPLSQEQKDRLLKEYNQRFGIPESLPEEEQKGELTTAEKNHLINMVKNSPDLKKYYG